MGQNTCPGREVEQTPGTPGIRPLPLQEMDISAILYPRIMVKSEIPSPMIFQTGILSPSRSMEQLPEMAWKHLSVDNFTIAGGAHFCASDRQCRPQGRSCSERLDFRWRVKSLPMP